MKFSVRCRTLTGAAALFLAGACGAGAAAEPTPASPVAADSTITAEGADKNPAPLAFLERRVKDDPDDVTALNRLSGIYLGRFRTTGRYEWLEHAAALATHSLQSVPAAQNLGGLGAQARVDAEYHRFGAARDAAQVLIKDSPKPAGAYLLLGDALFELGQQDNALAAWQTASKLDDIRIELPMRLARLHWLRGELEPARAAYALAISEVQKANPPQPSAAVWAYIQRGQMAFGLGDWVAAEADYQAAAQIAPNGFTVLDHLGELRAAQKRFPEAIVLYQRVVESTAERPEFMQSLGDVYAAAGNAEEAKHWHERALASYLASAAGGNGHYFHHLSGYYCDVAPNPAEALKWARKDVELRGTVFAYDSLGWALYANGDWAGAAAAAEKSLALNTPDPHLIFHAGMIFAKAGDPKRGGDLLRKVAEVNPRYYDSFHVHR